MEAKTLSIIDFIVTAVLALAFTAAPYYINTGNCEITLGYILTSLATFVIFLFLAYMARKILRKCCTSSNSKSSWKMFDSLNQIFSGKYATIYVTLLLLAAWIIPLCFLYPGTFINDTWGELQQFIRYSRGEVAFSDHHPIFDTLVMSVIIVPLSQLTGKWHVMIFIYVIGQALLTSLAFASTVMYVLKKMELGTKAAGLLLLGYCIVPIFPVAVQTVSKDALHSWGFVFFALMYIELIRTDGTIIKNKHFLIKFVLIILYCCLTKKIGSYVILLSLLVAFLFQKNCRKYVLIPIISSIVLMNVIMPMVRTSLQVSPGGKQEMFSLPFQMTARYVKYHSDDITDEEYEILDKVLTMDTLADRYDPTNADPVKDYYQKAEDEYYVKYIGVWIKQGLRHPGSYFSAFNAMLSGWFSWNEYAPLMNNDWRNQHNIDLIPEWVPVRGISKNTANAYQDMFHNLYSLPILQIFISYGFYASLIPAFAICTVFRKWKNRKIKYWMAICPTLFALFFGCWLAPVSYQLEGKRYLYPVVYTVPLIIMWCLYVYKSNSTTAEAISTEE